MIQTKRFNNIPEKLIPKIGKKPTVFKFITTGDPADPKSYPGNFMITNTARVKLDGSWYDIGFVERVVSGKDGDEPQFGDIWLSRSTFGSITCRPDVAIEEELYQFLMLHPWNASNPHRPEHVTPRFKVVNNEVEAKQRLDVSREEVKARYRAMTMEDKEVRMMAEYFGYDALLKPTVLREKLENQAKEDPTLFMDADAYVTKEGAFLEMVKRGKRHNIITMDGRNYKWKWYENKEVFKAGDPEVSVEQNEFKLAEWLRNNDDGKKVAIVLEKAVEKFAGEYEL